MYDSLKKIQALNNEVANSKHVSRKCCLQFKKLFPVFTVRQNPALELTFTTCCGGLLVVFSRVQILLWVITCQPAGSRPVIPIKEQTVGIKCISGMFMVISNNHIGEPESCYTVL